MSASRDQIINLAAQRKKEGIKKYTDEMLAREDLSPIEKMKIVFLNQENRLSIIMRVNEHTLEHLFKKYPKEFFTNKFHYDWWAFPMHIPKKWNWPERNYHASLTNAEAQTLLNNDRFTNNYLSCITLYLDALELYGWPNYLIRYSRMLHSLSLFLNAAKKLEHGDSVQTRLCALGERSINYAEKHLKSSDDELFTIGLKSVSSCILYYTELVEKKSMEIKTVQ